MGGRNPPKMEHPTSQKPAERKPSACDFLADLFIARLRHNVTQPEAIKNSGEQHKDHMTCAQDKTRVYSTSVCENEAFSRHLRLRAVLQNRTSRSDKQGKCTINYSMYTCTNVNRMNNLCCNYSWSH